MTKYEPIVKERPKNPKAKQQKGLFFFTLVGLVILVAIPIYIFTPKDKLYKLTDYDYEVVKSRTFRDVVLVIGEILPQDTVEIVAPFRGEIQSLQVESGTIVKKDDFLLEISSQELDENIMDAKNNVDKALGELEKSKLDYQIETSRFNRDRLEQEKSLNKLRHDVEAKKELFELGALSKNALTEAIESLEKAEIEANIRLLTSEKSLLSSEIALNTAENNYQVAKKRLTELEDLRKSARITSSIDGKLLDVKVNKGEKINSGVRLMKVISANNPYVNVKIPISESQRIEPNMPVVIKTLNSDYTGYVEQISLEILDDPQIGRHVEGKVVFNEDPGFILPNTECKVEIEVGRRENILYLNRGSFISTGQNRFVYLLKDNRAYKADVKYGVFDGYFVEITDGLVLGDKVITSSYDGFNDQREIEVDLRGGRSND